MRPCHRILLVEDHAPLAEAMADLVRSEGLHVRIASSGLEALSAAEEFEPEIVLCDLMLPDMPGLDVARALRQMPGLTHALLVMHTAITDADLQTLEHEVPEVDLFVAKPLTLGKLDALVARLEDLQRTLRHAQP